MDAARARWLRPLTPGSLVAVLALALALPLSVSFVRDGARLGLPLAPRDGVGFGLPRVFSGDEPHYLLMLNSVLNDGDLDLRDEYADALEGEPWAGRNFAREPLDHHTVWFTPGGQRWPWFNVYKLEAGPGPQGSITLRPGVPECLATTAEYSWHPPGLPLLLATVLWPVRGTRWTEPAALLLTALVTLATALFTQRLFRLFVEDERSVRVATLVAVLGSPLWAYSRLLFTEPWLACLCTAALVLALGSDRWLEAGLLIALGMQIKPPFGVVALPMLADAVLRRHTRHTLALAVPVAAGVAGVLGTNALFFGSPWRFPLPWSTGNAAEGVLGLLFSWNRGLLAFAPAILVALVGWREIFRTQTRQASIVAASVAVYFVTVALWWSWEGGYCYGPRMIVPVLPAAFCGLPAAMRSMRAWSPALHKTALALCAVSILVSAMGAFAGYLFWASHPLLGPLRLLAQALTSPRT